MFDTSTFSSPYMRALQGPYKVLWLYMKLTCDHAGIWDVELDIASVRCGFDYEEHECLKAFGDAVVPVRGGGKWFIPSFVLEQYGPELNPANKLHNSVINLLEKNFLTEQWQKIKGLASPLQAPNTTTTIYHNKDKDKDKDKSREEGGMGEGETQFDRSILDNRKVTPQSILSLHECMVMYLWSPICTEVRHIFCSTAQFSIYDDDPEKAKAEFKRLAAWLSAFNQVQAAKMQTTRQLGDYADYFFKWTKYYDLKRDPKQVFENEKSTINGNGQRSGAGVSEKRAEHEFGKL